MFLLSSLLFLLCLFLPLRGFAQNQSTAAITGTVTDTSGAPVAGAEVDVRNLATQVVVTTRTNSSGVYNVPQLQIGSYDVSISHTGFQTFARRGIELQVGQTARINARLEVGHVKQVVVVTAAPPLLQTDETHVGMVFSSKITQNLPLVGRTPTQLATLAPATSTVQSQQIGVGTSGSIDPGRVNVGGSRAFSIDATLDGGSVVLPGGQNFGNMIPALNAVSEFSIVQDDFGAQFGSGTSVLNMVLKSGGNAFHGTLFEFAENDALDATSRFALAKQKLRYNQFGGTLGGPVLKNRLFFFFSYQNTLSPSSNNAIVTVPTTAEAEGNFSAFSQPLIDPATGKPFPGNVIPSDQIDKVAANVIKFWPQPNCGGPGATTNNYCRLVPTNPQTPIYDARVDWSISPTNSFTFSTHNEPVHVQDTGLIPGPACFGGEACGVSTTHDQFYQLAERWTARSNLVNSAFFTFTREHYGLTSPTEGGNYPAKLGLTQNNISQKVFPRFSMAGAVPTSLGPGNYFAGGSNTFIYSDALTWVLGRHTLNIGGQYLKTQDQNPAQFGAPSFGFNGQFTGIGFADFLLGDVSSYSYSAQPIAFDGRRTAAALYIEDDWQATPHLTVNAGVRYQYEGAWTEVHNHTSNFSPTTINPLTKTPGAIIYASSARPNIQQGHPALFGPRLGFAESLPQSMVIRGAYGIFYIQQGGYNFNSNPPGYAINQDVFSLTPSSPPIFKLSSGPPPYQTPTAEDRNGGISNGQDIGWWPFDEKQAYLQDWNLAVEKQFGRNTTVEAVYVGAKGTHLLFPRDANQVPVSELGTPEDQTNPQALRPFPQYQSIGAEYTDGVSSYNALELKINRRFADGLTFFANYTYAKSMDNSSLDPTSGLGNEYQISADPQANWAASSFDLTNRGVIAYVYQLPVGRGRKFLNRGGVANVVLGGWQNSASFTASTGAPFTVFAASPNLTGSLAGSVFADVHGSTGGPRTAAKWFNTAAYSNPGPFTFGNSGRDSIRGPGQWDLDMALMKFFPIWHEWNFELRADAFNVLNHTNLGGPNSTLGSSAFGTITGASPARIMQVGGQINF